MNLSNFHGGLYSRTDRDSTLHERQRCGSVNCNTCTCRQRVTYVRMQQLTNIGRRPEVVQVYNSGQSQNILQTPTVLLLPYNIILLTILAVSMPFHCNVVRAVKPMEVKLVHMVIVLIQGSLLLDEEDQHRIIAAVLRPPTNWRSPFG